MKTDLTKTIQLINKSTFLLLAKSLSTPFGETSKEIDKCFQQVQQEAKRERERKD